MLLSWAILSFIRPILQIIGKCDLINVVVGCSICWDWEVDSGLQLKKGVNFGVAKVTLLQLVSHALDELPIREGSSRHF